VTRDEVLGVTPLTGAAAGVQEPRPARGYSWAPFEAGNTAGQRHGAYSLRVTGPLAEEILAGLLADPGVPDHVRSPAWRYQARAWAQAEAVAQVLYEHIGAMGAEAMVTPKLAGTRAPVDAWRSAAGHAARERARLGLDPASYARLRKDLGIAERAQEDALAMMAREGAKVSARRLRELPAADLADDSETGQSA
jgi:hypothetical protein